MREAAGRLPVNVKILVEGEEELASRSLPGFLRTQGERLDCDGIFGPFYGQNRRGVPVVKLGLKGVQFLELTCRGGAWGGPVQQEVHGAEAAWIASPAWQLVRTLASLVDEHDGPIVAGLAASAAAPSAEDEALLAELGARFSPQSVLDQQQTSRMKYARTLGALCATTCSIRCSTSTASPGSRRRGYEEACCPRTHTRS